MTFINKGENYVVSSDWVQEGVPIEEFDPNFDAVLKDMIQEE